jgi:hypothetical protein
VLPKATGISESHTSRRPRSAAVQGGVLGQVDITGLLPSPYHPPHPLPGRPFPPDVTDNRVLWDLDAQSVNALFGPGLNTHRASIGLPPVDNVRDHFFTDRPWRVADPTLGPWHETPDLDVVQTGAWILPDARPLPAELVDAGTTTVTRAGAPQVVMPQLWTSHTGLAGWPTSASARHTTVRLRPPSPCQPRSGRTLTPETRARATAVASTIRTDGATVAATLLLDTVSQEKPPVSA